MFLLAGSGSASPREGDPSETPAAAQSLRQRVSEWFSAALDERATDSVIEGWVVDEAGVVAGATVIVTGPERDSGMSQTPCPCEDDYNYSDSLADLIGSPHAHPPRDPGRVSVRHRVHPA